MDRGPRVMELCYLSWIFRENNITQLPCTKGVGWGLKQSALLLALANQFVEQGGGLTGAIQH